MDDNISPKTVESISNERSWEHAIQCGITNRGNLQVNLDFLKRTGLINVDKTLLELGCGTGNLAHFLHTTGVAVIGSDIAQTAIDHARKRYPDMEFRAHCAEELPYEDGSFDIVMSFDVLEHLSNVDRHLQEARRVLKPGGHYLLQTPNKLSNAIFETLQCRSLQWKKYHPSLHFFGQLHKRLRDNGFHCQFVKMNTMNEFAINKIKKIGLPGWLFSWINFKYLPFRLQTNFYVIARKACN